MNGKHWILLLVIIIVVYFALKERKESYPVLPLPKRPIPSPKKATQPSQRPKVNKIEDDPIITPPDISYHPPQIQTLIRLMWTDLRKMIDFKNELDIYDTERWYKKSDLFPALSFTDYSEFKGFFQRWKYEFSRWPEWEKYLEEWNKLITH